MILYDNCISICIIYTNIMFFGRSVALVESKCKIMCIACIRTISCELLSRFGKIRPAEVWPIAASAAWLRLGLQGKSSDFLALIVDVCTTHVNIPHKHKMTHKDPCMYTPQLCIHIIHVGTGGNVCDHDIACIIPGSFICLVGVLLLWLVTKASHLSILCVKQAMCPWPTGATSRRFSRNTQILGREQLIFRSNK